MSEGALAKVVSVNTADIGGGAEQIASSLFKGFQRRGLESWLIVGNKKSNDPGVVPFFQSPSIDYRKYGSRWYQQSQRWLKRIESTLGIEDYRFPYSKYLLTMTGSRPDVVHCHNLHGGYFDLRVLPHLSGRVPVFLTLEDCWWLTGHCAYPFGCTRWVQGCGACPQLSTPPAIRRDATRLNWRRKRRIFARCRLYVAAPSQWLMGRARRSMLAPAIVDSRLIPHGVDLNVFKPASQEVARRSLNIPSGVYVLVFVANLGRSNPFKDYATMRAAMTRLARQPQDRDIHFYCIGDAAPDERLGRVLIRHLPFETTPERLARYYQAADVYLHAAKDEAFGIVIAEAMACRTPVVATRVGGIPEVCINQQQGLLVCPDDSDRLAQAVQQLLDDRLLREKLGEHAAARAQTRFNQEHMIDAYLNWYQEVLESPCWRAAAAGSQRPPFHVRGSSRTRGQRGNTCR